MVPMVAADGRPVVWLHLTSPAARSSCLAQVGKGFGRSQPHPVLAEIVQRACGVPVVFTQRRYAAIHSAP